jgi:hypothetical protein
MKVPGDVAAAVDGWPSVGQWDPMIPLLTVDAAGFPHVCLLSRAELEADGNHLFAVIASPTTMANLQRSGKATLVTVGRAAAVYTKLTTDQIVVEHDWIGVVFDVASVKFDALGITLTPPCYMPTESLAVQENWELIRALLVKLKEME